MSDFINNLPKDDRVLPGHQAYKQVGQPDFDDLYAVGYAIKGGKRLRVNHVYLTRAQIAALASGAEVELIVVTMRQQGHAWERVHKYVLGVYSDRFKAEQAGQAEQKRRADAYRPIYSPATLDQPLKYWKGRNES